MISNTNSTISVIIPTLNEEDGIGMVLSSMPVEEFDEILVVDGSSDMTAEIARKYGARVIKEPRRGYGRALQTAIDEASGDMVVYIDGDFTYDPTEILSLIEPIREGRYDVVLGNRLTGANDDCMNFLNRIGNKTLSRIFSWVFGVKVNDTQTGLRIVPRLALVNQEYRSYGMAYVTEQLTKLIKAGYRVGEVPISYRFRIGRSKLHLFRDGLSILATILVEEAHNELGNILWHSSTNKRTRESS